MNALTIIVNYRTPDLTIDCLRSLAPVLNPARGDRVSVVDGDSGDDSVQKIGEAIDTHGWHEWVTLLPLDRNGGFAYANNAAMRQALASDAPPDCFWLLNADTIVHADALDALLDFLGEHPQAGIVGSRLESTDGSPQHASFRFPTLWSEFDTHLRLGIVSRLLKRNVVAQPIQDNSHQADWISGASLLVRRAVVEQVGLMDEAYFLYYEETDYCLQVRQAGWECWHIPESRVVHLYGQSTGVERPEGEINRRPRYWFDSRRRFFLKNHGALYSAAADAAALVGLGLWNARRVLQHKPRRDPPKFFIDMLHNSIFYRGAAL